MQRIWGDVRKTLVPGVFAALDPRLSYVTASQSVRWSSATFRAHGTAGHQTMAEAIRYDPPTLQVGRCCAAGHQTMAEAIRYDPPTLQVDTWP